MIFWCFVFVFLDASFSLIWKRTAWTFFRTSLFVFHGRKEARWIWYDTRTSKWWQSYHFGFRRSRTWCTGYIDCFCGAVCHFWCLIASFSFTFIVKKSINIRSPALFRFWRQKSYKFNSNLNLFKTNFVLHDEPITLSIRQYCSLHSDIKY